MTTAAPQTTDWAAFDFALLDALGAPHTPANVLALKAWRISEGTKAQYNPLATTLPRPGATNFNSVGVKNYADIQTGVSATAATLLQSNYTSIVTAMRHGASVQAIAALINASVWRTGKPNPDQTGYVVGNVKSLLSDPATAAHYKQALAAQNGADVAKINSDFANSIGGQFYNTVNGTGQVIATAASVITSPLDFLKHLLDPHVLARAGEYALGIALVIVGIILLSRQAGSGLVPKVVPV